MKYFAVLIIASFAAYVAADEEWKPIRDRATFMEMHEDCRKESGLTTEQTEMVLKAEYPDEKEVHDYVLCKTKKVGVFTDDKGYNIERLMAQLDAMFEDAEKLRDAVTGCIDSNEQKSSPAEWVYRCKQCMMKTKMGEMIKEDLKNHTS